MNITYENLIKVDFEFEKKGHLNQIEQIGLESILSQLIKDYETECFGESTCDITEVTRYNSDCVDILDGRYDVYVMNDFAITSICCTDNGIVLIECYPLDDNEEPNWDADSFFMRVN